MEYIPREDFRTWLSEVGIVYAAVVILVTIAMTLGSLGRYVGSADLQSGDVRTPSVEYLGPEGHVVPAAYP